MALAPVAEANTAHISAEELAAAVNQADSSAVPYRHGKLSAADVRRVKCIGPDEEPTEFQCSWQQRTPGGWAKRETWLAIDGRTWKVID
jgi:hypothetical protein